MRNIYKFFMMLGCFLSVPSFYIFAQVGINANNSAPDPSAMLDVKSTTKGMLIPRMTQAQIQTLADPANGLQVFCTTDDKIYIYVASAAIFKEIAYGTGTIAPASKTIGQAYGGGIIFYIDGTGQHGFIAAASDTDPGSGAWWGCYGTLIGGTSISIGSGQANTTVIVSGCNEVGIAARICNDLVLNGYDDWFLPSKDELNELYLQKNVVGGFNNHDFWSSSESDASHAWGQGFSTGYQFNSTKGKCYVRAIRAF